MQQDHRSRSSNRALITMLALGLAVWPASGALSQSMNQALTSAQGNSPALDAARRDLAAIEERLPQARSGFFPQMDFLGSAGVSNEFTDTQDESFSANADATLSLVQPIYRSGGTVAAVDQAGLEIQAQQATMKEVEQSVLLETATAFMDVWRDQQTVGFIGEATSLLTTELQSITRQQQLGAASKTDVAQTEVQLGQLQADLIGAETSLAGSSAQFARLTGARPEPLQLPALRPDAIPASADDAVALADAGNPALNAATFRKLAAQKEIDAVSANYGPSIDLRTALQYFSADIQEQGGEIDDDVAIARADVQLTVPLYSGGLASARSREVQEVALAEDRREEDTRRQVRTDAGGAWTRTTSARNQIERLEEAVAAADRAAKGTEREYELGKRTTLDLLNARRDLLDLQIALVSVMRDLHVAYFELLAVTGRLEVGQN